ncbi:choice-of-anchor L domain-containing protein [Empedobacter falsenii]|uniref:T9SS type B sorting domain-containing protein n=1 Tax=Empedobacter falsenii TaxID=343874 RepID=A0AAW7DEI7_9FLAO|nr:choice-of-anchor L domain-containing protein [Empedobacter falsenii]MDM1549891.1 T9SS type B sorting domain-containing protein [Empedobacter falsenii]
MKHFYSKIILLLFFTFILNSFLFGQYIQVDTSLSKEQLIDKFIGTSCIDIEENSIQITGWNFDNGDKSYGYFNGNSSSFPISNGILLSTGKLSDIPGPNIDVSSETSSNWRGDIDLERALGISNTTDATVLEFDFISNQTNQISFDYLFASEQYYNYKLASQCNYTDGFAFLIKEAGSTDGYQNLAVIPNTTTPVAVNTVRGSGTICTPANTFYFDQFNPSNYPISYGGQTKIMTAQTTIKTGIKYHLKIVIADQGNGFYDSAVFLKAGSFVGSKSLGSDVVLCSGTSETIDATTTNATAYKWYKDGEEINGETNATLVVDETGYYEVEITQNTGCSLKGHINVSVQEEPQIYQDRFSICDDDLDGKTQVKLDDYTDRIVEDYYSAHQVKYFETKQDAKDNISAGITNFELNDIQKSKEVWIRVQIGTCKPVIEKITFTLNNLSVANIIPAIEICDEDLSNDEDIVLSNYIDDLVTNIYGSPTYYLSEADAKNRRNAINATQIINSDQTFWVRFKQKELCENVAPLHFIFKQSGKSSTLKDVTICKGTTTTLDAGAGFDTYEWLHNGNKNQSITNISIGTYYVKLGLNGCFYTQEVNVIEAEDPTIQSIEIQGSTVTIKVTGSTPPYLYSLDNGAFQSSNIFTNVTLGTHTIYVKSADNCTPISKEFSLIKLINFISPNGDGKNDVLDYSQLKSKINPKFVIYNRKGKLLFTGSEANNYTWDGKLNGKTLPSDSYWYIIEWTEPNSTQTQKFEDWILLKSTY